MPAFVESEELQKAWVPPAARPLDEAVCRRLYENALAGKV